MQGWRGHLAVAGIAAPVAVMGTIAACVGDDPTPTAFETPDGATATADTGPAPDAAVAPADAGEEDATPDTGPSWTPAGLPGLAFWLDGSKVEVDGSKRVTSWPDQSPNAAVARPASTPPSWASSVTELGGRPAVRFARTPLVVSDAAPIRFGTSSFTLAIVARHTTPTDPGDAGPYCYAFVFSKQNSDFPFPGPVLQLNTESCDTNAVACITHSDTVTSAASGLNDGKGHVFVMTRTIGVAASLGLRIDGADVGVLGQALDGGVARDVSSLGFDLYIGGSPAGQDLVGDVAEVVAIRGDLPAADRAQLEAYLQGRYGL